MNNDTQKRIDFIQPVVKEAADMLNEWFHTSTRAQADRKVDGSFATKYDLEVESFIHKKIRQNYEFDGYIGEETGEDPGSSGFLWLIDPIDGTTNFLTRVPLYTVSVGLQHEGKTVGGAVCTSQGEVFAADNSGRIISPSAEGANTSDTPNTSDAIVALSFAQTSKLKTQSVSLYQTLSESVHKIRVFGSTSYEGVLLSVGAIDAIVSIGAKKWDFAGVESLLTNTGKVMIDFGGNEWTLDSPSLIAADEDLAQKLAALL